MQTKTKNGIPLIGLGTWGLGGRYEPDSTHISDEVSAVQFALERGYRLIDTAEMYGKGMTEIMVGKAIADFPRKEIFIISKVWSDNLRHDDVLKAAAGTLKRLNTDYLDCYLIHWPNDSIPMEETFRALSELKEKGSIKAFGVSNFDKVHLAKALSICPNIMANEIEYNVINQGARKDVIPFCQENNIDVIAYRPLSKGRLIEDKRLQNIANKYSCSVSELALAWILNQGISAIPKASTKEHIESNWRAKDIKLSDEDIELLRNN
jgi:diketogulonate reductase-like aldo/keto reductase